MHPTMDTEGPSMAEKFVLPGYEAGQGDCGVRHSFQKLETAGGNLKHHLPQHISITSFPSKQEEDSWAYRCRCTFQVIRDDQGRFHYAMRHQRNPIRLETDKFPIATFRIQNAMEGLMLSILNNAESYATIKQHLTSATFSSSWHDTPEADCIVTLHYEQPISESWKEEAKSACDVLKLRQLNGRSKKRVFCALEDCQQTIRDTLYINGGSAANGGWEVSLAQSDKRSKLEVYYEKPETAFYHPNALAMKKALKWMLDRLVVIIGESDKPCRLLEMYCGCGAHTVALAKTGLLEGITAVELDNRLVDACIKNIQMNKLEDIIQVAQEDAGAWAKSSQKKKSLGYDIILVDPPRHGLDDQVCRMVLEGSFRHFLYISCGHQALLRDLGKLSSSYEVVDCAQLDLFPRTDSIETLVHLQRRADNDESIL